MYGTHGFKSLSAIYDVLPATTSKRLYATKPVPNPSILIPSVCSLVKPDIFKTDNTYNNEVIKLMSKSKKKEYCYVLDKCDDIAANITKIDGSLTKSHQAFSKYRKIILEN